MARAVQINPLPLFAGGPLCAWRTWFGRGGVRRPAVGRRPPPPASTPYPLQGDLLDAYAASLIEVACLAEALQVGDRRPAFEPVALQAATTAAADRLKLLAAAADLRLLCDAVEEGAACFTDPLLLRRVLDNLVLQALSRESPGGHVRLAATLLAGEARITVLSRAPADLQESAAELVGARRVLAAMGASAGFEPRRAGYLPMTVVLRTPAVARPAQKAA